MASNARYMKKIGLTLSLGASETLALLSFLRYFAVFVVFVAEVVLFLWPGRRRLTCTALPSRRFCVRGNESKQTSTPLIDNVSHSRTFLPQTFNST